jgi:hypothetical protein
MARKEPVPKLPKRKYTSRSLLQDVANTHLPSPPHSTAGPSVDHSLDTDPDPGSPEDPLIDSPEPSTALVLDSASASASFQSETGSPLPNEAPSNPSDSPASNTNSLSLFVPVAGHEDAPTTDNVGQDPMQIEQDDLDAQRITEQIAQRVIISTKYPQLYKFLSTCTPELTHLMQPFVYFGCDTERMLVAMASWSELEISQTLFELANFTRCNITAMDMIVLRRRFAALSAEGTI